ncbi:dTDP-4-dehydrorhamnose 3,5-epimerase [Fusobacterium massiliense]|uniref:dTDP-4-dehydrorhamnose 3,5-epimerase n=1 Tax=Fusobacterium massiliense TaxID=1852365 RepID=UPI000938F826|nr:dTDP-4-dehydrorhamnose 3,5-epimerase [Fusobacterium massiliense]
MKFKKIETEIQDLVIIEPTVFEDNRGFFLESYNYNDFKEIGIDNIFVQDNHSKSSKGVLRGLHFQKGEFAQAKLVRVLKGAVLDVAVDLRKDSQTFGKYVAIELSEENKKMFFIPRGLAHGFLALTDEVESYYKCDNFYTPQAEDGLVWNDANLKIEWNFKKYNINEKELIISEKDKKNKTFFEYKKENKID